MPAVIILPKGSRYGRLVVVEKGPRGYRNQPTWKCICDCGNLTWPTVYMLRCGKTQSCGCLQKERAIEGARRANTTHGHTARGKTTREFITWSQMLDRCYNIHNKSYSNYGGRGIGVCSHWKHSFENFLTDMGPKPQDLTLDRIDNNANYFPANCRWVTRLIQNNNRRNTKRFTIDGITRTLKEWSIVSGVKYHTIYMRIRDGWPIHKAIFHDPSEYRSRPTFPTHGPSDSDESLPILRHQSQ